MPVRLEAVPVRDASGEIVGAVQVFTDQTERMEAIKRVEELTGMQGGLELFARASRPGWLAWGLEVGKFD